MRYFSQYYKVLIRTHVAVDRSSPLGPILLRKACFLLLGITLAGAAAATEIDSDTTTPVTTSTANDGTPDNVTITEDGEIDLTGSSDQTAVTVDSDHSVTNEGSILAEDTDNVIGIHVTTGRTLDIVQDGTIQLIEDYDREDEDDDDDIDGPLAIGSNRIGILIDDGAAFEGSVSLGDYGSVYVEGNDSAGIIINSELNGTFAQSGSVAVIGGNAVGILLAQEVSGDVTLNGSVSATGANAAGLEINGDIGGSFSLESTVSSTGFTNASATNYIAPAYVDEDTEAVADRLDPDDLYDNAFAVRLTGSVANGVLLNGPVDDFTSTEDEEDETKDTVDDFDENRGLGRIYSYGSGTALDIEALDKDLVLGPVVEFVHDTLDDDDDDDTDEVLAEFYYSQGLINRGTIFASGVNIGFDATALSIHGAEDGSSSVVVEGGILNSGLIQANAFEASALAVALGSSVQVGTLENSGSILAITYTLSNDTATALRIGEGSELSTLVNSGTIRATSNGYGGIATAILDESHTLISIENTGTISAALVSDGREDLGTGEAVAINLSGQTSDTMLVQYERTPTEDTNGDEEIDTDDVLDPSIVGDILFGSGNDVFRVLGGTVSGDTDFGVGNVELELDATTYVGNIQFRDGAISANLSDVVFVGDIQFGAATGTFSILQGSEFSGNLYGTGFGLAASIDNAIVSFNYETDLQLASLNVSGETTLLFELDPRNLRTNPFISVGGTATLSDATSIEPVLSSLVANDFSITLIEAATLDFNSALATLTTTNVPWIYDVSLTSPDASPNQLDLSFHLKSASELDLDPNQTSAYAAVLQIATSDDDIGSALTQLTTEKTFLESYNLLLPQRTDAATRYLESQSNAAFSALSEHLALNRVSSESGNGVWVQESYTNVNTNGSTSAPGYNGRGLGLTIGYDKSLFGLDAIGIIGTMSDGKFEEKTGGQNPVTMKSLGIGIYASDHIGTVNLQLATQYSDISHASYRRVIMSDYYSDVSGSWGGTSKSASLLASTILGSGPLQLTPRASLDYFSLDQDAYQETASNGLNLAVSEAHTERITADAGLAISWTWKQTGSSPSLGPAFPQSHGESAAPPMARAILDLGYRSTLSSTPYSVRANFVGYDELFLLQSTETFGNAATAGVSLLAGSEYLKIRLGVGAEFSDDATVATASASLKLRF